MRRVESHTSQHDRRDRLRVEEPPTARSRRLNLEGPPVLARVARFCFRKRWIMVFAVWLPLLFVNAVVGAIGTDYHTDFTQPDSESKQVQDALCGPVTRRRRHTGADRVHGATGHPGPGGEGGHVVVLRRRRQVDSVKVVEPVRRAGRRRSAVPRPDRLRQRLGGKRSQADFMTLADDIKERGAQVDVTGLPSSTAVRSSTRSSFRRASCSACSPR